MDRGEQMKHLAILLLLVIFSGLFVQGESRKEDSSRIRMGVEKALVIDLNRNKEEPVASRKEIQPSVQKMLKKMNQMPQGKIVVPQAQREAASQEPQKVMALPKDSQVKKESSSNSGLQKVSPKKKKFKTVFAVIDVDGLPAKDKAQIKIKLFHLKTPKTVDNFIQLAEGAIKTPNRNLAAIRTRKEEPEIFQKFYDGLIFHRIIPGFMVQGGCPEGTGRGGPGYTFKDEPVCELTHHKAGVLSMANRGPHTNGSQFFITLAPTPHLDLMTKDCKPKGSGHTVFGEVVEGMDVVKALAAVKKDFKDKPLQDVKIKSLTIVRQ